MTWEDDTAYLQFLLLAVSPERPRMKIPKPTKHLVFQGGGGKGLAYIGALRTLEKDVSLRLTDLVGVAGASAGAITALLVACRLPIGDRAKDPANRLSITRCVDNAEFELLLEDVVPGRWRIVTKNGPTTRCRPPGDTKPLMPLDAVVEFVQRNMHQITLSEAIEGVKLALTDVGDNVAAFGAMLALILKKGWVRDLAVHRMLTRLMSGKIRLSDVVKSLWNDLGIFDGIPIRVILRKWVADALAKAGKQKHLQSDAKSGKLTFRQFCEAMEIDLRVTGTNLTTQRPFVFSMHNSPDFPVTEAVGISMTIPFLFKPVEVGSDCKGVDAGFWVDGGCLNNLPLHCFDAKDIGGRTLPKQATCSLLQDVLALQLVPGQATPSVDERGTQTMDISQFVSALVQTFLYPSTEGQILSQSDRAHVIPIHFGQLSTCDFKPDDNSIIDGELNASQSVVKWLERKDDNSNR